MSDFHALKVASIDKLTPSAVALSFDIPDALRAAFSFEASVPEPDVEYKRD